MMLVNESVCGMLIAIIGMSVCLEFQALNTSFLTENEWNDEIQDCCRNKCGVYSLSTCSCDVRCKIVRNCCKDFQKSCPEEFKQSEDRFENFLQLIQECDSSGYLLISGCPRDSSPLKEVDTDIVTRLQGISEGHGAVNRLFSHVPVTDMDSGFSFKNVSVYLCNAMPGNNMKFWNVYIDNFSVGSNGVLTYDELSRAQFRVFPSIQLDKNEKISRCHFADEKYIVSKRSELKMIAPPDFKGFDSFCALCYMNQSEKWNESDKDHRHKFTFPIIATFKNNQFIFQTELLYSGREVVPWQFMQCSNLKIDKEENLVDSSLCSIESCSKDFEQTSDGQCKILYILQLAVPDDAIPMTKSFLGRLSSYLECYLTKYSGYDVIDKWHLSERFFDDEEQKTFLITPLLLYSSAEIDILNNRNVGHYYFSQFAHVIQVLRSYSSRLKVKGSEKRSQAMPVSTFTLWELQRLKFTGDINKSTAIPVCANFASRHYLKYPIFHSLFLQCVYISVDDDEGNITREKMDTENNTCLNVFTFSAQPAHMCPAAFVLYLALVCFILK